MHSNGFVIGCLGQAPDCAFSIDANDNAVLYKQFEKSYAYDNFKVGVVPPEHRHLASIERPMKALSQTDIYQLGLQLWQIAANQNCGLRSRFCKIAACTTKGDKVCTEADPTQLPSPGEHTPQYLREVIAACRAVNADERPPAWKLLEMFPPVAEGNTKLMEPGPVDCDGILHPSAHQDNLIETGIINGNAPQQTSTRTGTPVECTPIHLTRLEECIERYDSAVSCDICGERTTNHFFHCKICLSAD